MTNGWPGSSTEAQGIYETAEISEAMRMGEADLTELDASWLEILGFTALRSWPILRADSEFGRSLIASMVPDVNADIRRVCDCSSTGPTSVPSEDVCGTPIDTDRSGSETQASPL
jgi:hypothetical protein